ncbi:MAG: glutathione S-transferase N-terminal domain-containing protein [Candidatus Carbobacillus altaicus]|uniref:Glutaredoxin n=1 Tax=Candidatus Carbonibacillus altaicus TaxID=2163959 RepID=A0A2R6XZ72_9BACL|nr:glutathione S-transferase N-terminal domain-containing protein [Candidatus Carbobacillus altaicus]PTQ55724.1 MAG: Glutaredoxin [Candidatus Carbobacillus altaicus]
MLELYGAKGCPYTKELRETLELSGEDFIEYDVERDREAFSRLVALSGGQTVPVLVESGRILQVGYEGRGCYIRPPDHF